MLIAGSGLILTLARGLWIPAIARSLVCTQNAPIETFADAILIDNVDFNYLLFERAAALNKALGRPRTFVPTQASPDPSKPNMVSERIVDVMARVSRLDNPEIIPIREVEPVSLNAAYQVRAFLEKEAIESVIIVTPGFRSRRSDLVYRAVLSQAGMTVGCAPVFMQEHADTWPRTWHGIQNVAEQFIKLQYYRFYVLPFVLKRHA